MDHQYLGRATAAAIWHFESRIVLFGTAMLVWGALVYRSEAVGRFIVKRPTLDPHIHHIEGERLAGESPSRLVTT